jgi:hypothetical protein
VIVDEGYLFLVMVTCLGHLYGYEENSGGYLGVNSSEDVDSYQENPDDY